MSMNDDTNNLNEDEVIDQTTTDVVADDVEPSTDAVESNAPDKASEYLAGWQRALADYKNLQEKSKFQAALSSEMARASVFSDLAAVIDNFSSALTHVPEENKKDDWVVGLSHVKQQLLEVCRQHGLELIDAVDVEFDPNIHEAISYQPSDRSAGQVVSVVAIGMRMGERIIRPAKVVVAAGPSK